jgi:hypothetical protein
MTNTGAAGTAQPALIATAHSTTGTGHIILGTFCQQGQFLQNLRLHLFSFRIMVLL